MSRARRKATGDTFRVVRPMDGDGRLTVRPLARWRTYEITGYADEGVRRRLAALEPGDAVRLDLEPAAGDDDAYVAVRAAPGGPPA